MIDPHLVYGLLLFGASSPSVPAVPPPPPAAPAPTLANSEVALSGAANRAKAAAGPGALGGTDITGGQGLTEQYTTGQRSLLG